MVLLNRLKFMIMLFVICLLFFPPCPHLERMVMEMVLPMRPKIPTRLRRTPNHVVALLCGQ